MPERYRVVPILRENLETAGIPYSDESGRVAGFHSLRHTFISNLADADLLPRDAQELARHSIIALTMSQYTSARREKPTSVLSRLPDPSKPERVAVRRRAPITRRRMTRRKSYRNSYLLQVQNGAP